MKRCLFMLGAVVLACVMTTGCEKNEQIVGTEDDGWGTGLPGVPDSLVLAQTFPPLLANGEDQVTVHATVVDGTGKGLGDVGVIFTTSHGTIEPFATTDGDGVAETVLTSEASVADVAATVMARAGSGSDKVAPPKDALVLITQTPASHDLIMRALKDRAVNGLPAGATSLSMDLVQDQVQVPMAGISLTLNASPATIPADGISQSHITATLVETTSRVPLAGEEVRFGASSGSITGRVDVDATGSAVAVLTASPGETASQVTVFYGKTLTAQSSVAFSPLTLSLDATNTALVADGVSSTDVTALLVNQEGNPVAGARLDFSTTLGTIMSPVETDTEGRATTTLVSGTTTGTAEVSVEFSSALTSSVDVSFVESPATAQLLLRVEPAILPADGGSEAQLVATALDGESNPMPDGTPVTFTIIAGGGRIIGPVAVTQTGVAEAIYVAGTSEGTVTVQASSGSAVESVSIVLTNLSPAGLTLAVDSPVILANGIVTATITATVTDIFGHPVLAGTVVDFRTSRGILDGITPTDEAGTASAFLRSSPLETGTARVTVSAGDAQGTIDIQFVSEAAAHIEAIDVDPPQIGVFGSGDHEVATITFEVQDCNGIPVDADHAVTLAFQIVVEDGATDATVCPETAVTNERGQVAASVNAGIRSGVCEIKATSGSLLSEPIRVAIHGGLPDPENFSLSFERLNIAGLKYDGILNRVTAHVGDIHGNPVPEGTRVWFSAEYGLVQGSAGTNEYGQAIVYEVTAAQYPAIPGGNGLVRIIAQTVSRLGTDIYAGGHVMWSGDTILDILEPATLTVPNAGAVSIRFQVSDANNNPLVGGTTITVDSTAGTLGGDVNVVLPDTQSGHTVFEVVLMDDNPTEDLSQPVTVTITVTSQNGNASDSITGTIN